ncbi:MAG TPA: hypothetical protein VK699_10245 [Terriglobales bacterium]|jgi:hypothetical protein|nr:hypothetical protein [Terriglobales bacterium]
MDRVFGKPHARAHFTAHFSGRAVKSLFRIVFLAAIVVAMAASSYASIRIGGWSLRANGEVAQGFQYTGSCPVDLKFGWGVVSTEPTTVTYTFVRSDGGHSSSPQTASLAGGGRSTPIYDDWRLGADTPQFANYSGWVEIDIQGPNPVSQKINFTIHCQGPTVRVGGWSLRANGQLAQNFQYTGSCPVDLKFGWGVISTAPTTLTYTFARSDGGHSSSSQSASLPGGGRSTPIYDDWRLGANTPQFRNYGGWVELNTESPNHVAQKIPFTIHCQ